MFLQRTQSPPIILFSSRLAAPRKASEVTLESKDILDSCLQRANFVLRVCLLECYFTEHFEITLKKTKHCALYRANMECLAHKVYKNCIVYCYRYRNMFGQLPMPVDECDHRQVVHM